MSDLIDRQAALEALNKRCVCECEYSKKQRSIMCGACYLGSAIEVIEMLPSAQPEADEVARDMATIIENEKDMRVIRENAEQRWIPCKERLPESFSDVLCCDKYGSYLIGHPYEDNESFTEYSAEDDDGCLMIDCVAWMPLPKPWKGE